MAAMIEEEGLDEDGRPITIKCHTSHWKLKQKQKPHKSTTIADEDQDDENYSASDSDSQLGSSSESENNSDVQMVSNNEVRTSVQYLHLFNADLFIHFLAC